MTEQDGVLIRLLAATDAAFMPCREFTRAASSNLYLARREYPRLGVVWVSGGDEQERKQAQRDLEALARAGLLTTFRPKQKTIRAKLTRQGEDVARALVGLPGVHAGWESLRQVRAWTVTPAELLTDVWISEQELAGERPADFTEGRWLALVEELALPALVRGWLVSGSTVHGHVSYRVSDEGRRAIEAGDEPPLAPELEIDDDARELYYDSLQEARGRLTSGPPVKSMELGDLPLQVAIEGVLLGEV